MSILEDLKMQIRVGGIVTQLIFWNIAFFVLPVAFFGISSLWFVENSVFSKR